MRDKKGLTVGEKAALIGVAIIGMAEGYLLIKGERVVVGFGDRNFIAGIADKNFTDNLSDRPHLEPSGIHKISIEETNPNGTLGRFWGIEIEQ